jgi:hypothetical protein
MAGTLQFISKLGPRITYKYLDPPGGEETTIGTPQKKMGIWFLGDDKLVGYSEPDPEPETPASQGNTTVEPEPEPKAPSLSKYGNVELDARSYTVGKEVSGEGGTKTEKSGQTIPGGQGVRSLFNHWALHKYKNHANGSPDDTGSQVDNYNKTVYYHGEAGAPDPTARNIIQDSINEKSLGYTYNISDFVQCEHYGKISNDYMITLRRFAYPVGDDLKNMLTPGNDGKLIDGSQPDLARAITWMSPKLGNDMKEILKFGTKFSWKEVESELQKVTSSSTNNNKVGSMIDGSPLASAINAGVNGYSADQAARIKEKGAGWDPTTETYPNKVYGPLNVIKKVLTREQGLEFNQEFTLKFHYDLKGFTNTSPKVAFMDTLSNVLALTYNNAPFWGGATRYLGNGSTVPPFGDFQKLKSGDYEGFLTSIGDQLKGAASAFADAGAAIKEAMTGGGINALGDSKIMDNLIGGGLMKMFNSPQGAAVAASFISGDPTGMWHVTIGNPMNPMMVVGNLALESSNVEFEGPLGYEGFPSKMILTVNLKPARPRDKGEIESMFNAGRGRMYLQPEVEGAVDLDKMVNLSAYGGKDKTNKHFTSAFAKRISDMNAG